MDSQKIDGYVAFLDILGFSELVKHSSFDDEFDQYSEVISTAACSNGDLDYATFSDSLVISTGGKTSKDLREILQAVAEITYQLLVELDVPVCGCIAEGRFSRLVSEKSDLMIAGVPIVEAVHYTTRQDWLGVMLSPSTLKADPDFIERAEFEKCASETDLERLRSKLPWPLLVHRYYGIPFHSPNDLVENQFDGYVVVPHLSQSSTPPAVLADLGKYLVKLDDLKLVAPEPSAQRKYTQTRLWIDTVRRDWIGALSGRWPDSAET